MDYVINKLQELRDSAIMELKQGKKEFLKTKLELDRAISCLEFCMEYGLLILSYKVTSKLVDNHYF